MHPSRLVEVEVNNNRYAGYAVALLAGSAIALWAGLSPFFLLFFVACPLMMFFMMRGGMHGGHGESHSASDAQRNPQPTPPSDLDGSHERIDRS